MKTSDIKAELKNVDRKDALERAKTTPALRIALEISRPKNWWGTGILPEQILKIAEEDGIPVAWVPSSDLLLELDSASDRRERLVILRKKQERILNHCGTLMSECSDQWIADERYLADRSLVALQAGHYEASLALAVSIGEPLAVWASKPRVKAFSSEEEEKEWNNQRKGMNKYYLAKYEIENEPLESHRVDMIHRALIAPIPSFFKPFRLEKGDEIPKQLSRHAVVHAAKKGQFSLDNAILGLMLISSILYQMQRWCDEVRSMDMDH